MSRESFVHVSTSILCLLQLVLTSCERVPSPALVSTASSGVTSTETSTFSTQPIQSTQGALSDPYGHPVFHVGDIISAGNGALVVSGWEILPEEGPLKPDPSNKFIAIEIVVVNLNSSAVTISSLMQVALRDDGGRLFNISYLATAMAKDGTIDGELSPGERVRGKLGFQISKDARGLQLIFNAKVLNMGNVFVDLGAKPVMFGTPPPIYGEVRQPAYYVRNLILIDWLEVIVLDVTYPAIDQNYPPAQGFKYLVVDLTLQNKGVAPLNVSSLSQMWVKDGTGRKFTINLEAMSNLKLSSPDGNITGGEKKHGQVGFQIPVDASDLVFVIDADRFDTGKAYVIIPP